MARKRTTKRRSKRKSTRRRGTGSIITVRKAGMGMLKGTTGYVVPPLIGGGTAAATALAIRQWITPDTEMKQTLYKWAWLFGAGAGFLSSGLLFLVGGRKKAARGPAMAGAASALVVGLAGFGYDMYIERMAANAVAAAGTEGLGAVVFQKMNGMGSYGEDVSLRGRRRLGTGAIVPEYGGGGMGAMRGINTSVFGTPGFG